MLFEKIPNKGIDQDELKKLPYFQIGFNKAMELRWLKVDKINGKTVIFKRIYTIEDATREQLKRIKQLGDFDRDIMTKLKWRKLITEVTIKSLDLKKGLNFSVSMEKDVTDLTPEMIIDNTWQDKKFKRYNFDAMGISPKSGHYHPLLKVKRQFRQIFLEMGFSEMETNKFVESSFWNFDALFQPQNHPARDEHDTFFIEDPKMSYQLPTDYVTNVKKVHSEGGYGSIGYQYDWKLLEAQKNVLRTHTTANSARMLYKLAQEGFRPVKYFSIDKVYRNENMDATHLAEFHQIEGVVAGYNLSLGDLMGVLKEFYKKLGLTKLKFKPTYNPYTEPSMEIFSYHEGLKKWVEIGNSGIFRPELLLPMGLPPDISVIAWGLSLERPTMILYDVSNIRELVGHKVNLQMVYRSPICFFK